MGTLVYLRGRGKYIFVGNGSITVRCNNFISNSLVSNSLVATSGENFTDREKETERLLSNFRYGVNTVLISPRRWGKTSLVQKVCTLAESDELRIVYLDIFACRSDRDFYDAFASAVIKQTSSKWEEWVENAKLSAIEILQLPEKIAEKKGCRMVVCIDEFQQIGEFKDSKNFQKQLRSIWQLQKSVSYCLFGSKKHLMNELFEKKSLPFYKFGDAIYLNKIATSDWIAYICGRFEATGKKITRELAEKICLTVDNHSSYVQQLSWLLWIHTDKEATEEIFQEAVEDLLAQNTPLFEKQTEDLTTYQMNFLRAITEGIHTEFTTQENLRKYQLGTSANVSIIKRSLQKKELIEAEKKQVYMADPVLELWLRREFI